jgi:transposase
MRDKRLPLVSLEQTRSRLVKERMALKNKASNILNACGLNLTEEALSGEENLAELLELPRNEIVRMQLRVILRQIRALNTSIVELDRPWRRAKTRP